MNKPVYVIFLLFSFFIPLFFICSENIILDKVVADENSNISITVHNVNEPGSIQLILDEQDFKDFKIDVQEDQLLFILIVDNSGSIFLDDFNEIKDRVVFFIDRLKKNDYLQLYKVNNQTAALSPLSHPGREMKDLIRALKREGRLSRIYDAIIQANGDLKAVVNQAQFKDYYPYLVLFSDGDDVGSENRNQGTDDVVLYDQTIDKSLPFFYFSYDSIAKETKHRPLEKLARETKGKRIIKPSRQEIIDLFFNKQKRATIRFQVNKNELLTREHYFLDIVENENQVKIDLRKLFDENNQVITEIKNQDALIVDDNPGKDQAAAEKEGKREDRQEEIKAAPAKETADQDQQEAGNKAVHKDKADKIEKKEGQSYLFLLWLLLLILLLLLLLFAGKKLFDYLKERNKPASGGGRSAGNRISVPSGGSGLSSTPVTPREQQSSGSARTLKIDKSPPPSSPKTDIKSDNNLSIEEKQASKDQEPAGEITRVNKIVEETTPGDEKLATISRIEKEIEEKVSQEQSSIDGQVEAEQEYYFRKAIDLLKNNKYNKFFVFHHEDTRYIDDIDHHGEEVEVNVKLLVRKISENKLHVEGDVNLFLDEVVIIKDLEFKSKKIKYDKIKKKHIIELTATDEKILLPGLFSENETVVCDKKTVLFGNPNAVIEKMVANKRPVFYDYSNWKKAKGEKKENQMILYSRYPLILDTVFEVKTSQTAQTSARYCVIQVKRNKGLYQNILKLY